MITRVGVMKDWRSKTVGSTLLTYTGWRGGLEHLKIETRLIDERFVSVMGECHFDVTGFCLLWIHTGKYYESIQVYLHIVFLFIINRESEIYIENLYMSIDVMED